MSLFVGKSGADAVFKYIAAICRVVLRYNSKLRQLIDLAESHSYITADQKAQALAFLDGLSALCTIFETLAGLSGFTN